MTISQFDASPAISRPCVNACRPRLHASTRKEADALKTRALAGAGALFLSLFLAATGAQAQVVPISPEATRQGTVNAGPLLQMGRYTMASSAPEASRSQPMTVVAVVHFPRATVKTVGEALKHLLERTGYALIDESQLEPVARGLLALPLPESHRALGPYRVEDMVQVLLGDRWGIRLDHLQRQVAFSALGTETPADATTAQAAISQVKQ